MKKNFISALPIDFYLNSFDNKKRTAASYEILNAMREVTGEQGVVWNDKVIGFGEYQYKKSMGYGETVDKLFVIGFWPQKLDIVIHSMYSMDLYKDILAEYPGIFIKDYGFRIRNFSNINLEVIKKFTAHTFKMFKENAGLVGEHNKSLTKKKHIIA